MSSTAPLAIVRGTARELFLRHPRGGRLYVVASRLHLTTTTRAATDGPSQDKPWPESAHEYDPSVVLNKTGFLVTVQASRKAKRVRNAVEEAKYMLGTCADPPSLGDSLPLHKAGELGCAFLPLLGYRPHAVVPYARECIETFVSDPPPPSDTPEYLARLVPVERTCDASVDVIEETLRQLLTTPYPELTPTLEPKTYHDSSADPIPWTMHYEHHGHDADVSRRELTDAVASMFPAPDFTADLSQHADPKDRRVCVFISVYESVALVAVSRDWDLLRGYHVRELVERREVEREGEAHTVAETTGGGGYP